ncbi:hypothetical protein [Archangium primigenium]|uniref:hypothetical protein n=1 Tax=[Archangium] primigenium TaxID=2792470 RepID=UPI00195B3507|nr:hypothetical protein [Archangium primigenium]MBM7117691.1 hypothetical protein [Archangium primigenium]
MRTCALGLLGLLATACGGNFSNDDLEFLNALPARTQLMSKLPRRQATGQALTARPLADKPIAVGDPSGLYAQTHEASERFNAALEGLLTRLERIRAQTPTTREPDLRIWGPVEDREHTGHQVRFVMTRREGFFTYQLQYKPRGQGEEGWWSFVEGTFEAQGGLREGTGTVSLQVALARAHGFDLGGLASYRRLDVAYQTREPPLRVQMDFVPTGLGRAALRYTYREAREGFGEMTFLLEDTAVLPGNQRADLSVLSRWTQAGDGVARAVATGGDIPPALDVTQVECWDTRFGITYFQRGWEADSEVGHPSACPDVSLLAR